MNVIEQSLELKVKPNAAKPLLRTRAVTKSADEDFPPAFVKVMGENLPLKGRLHVLALNGWPNSGIHLWRAHYTTAALSVLGRDVDKALAIEVPTLDLLKAYVAAFYTKASV